MSLRLVHTPKKKKRGSGIKGEGPFLRCKCDHAFPPVSFNAQVVFVPNMLGSVSKCGSKTGKECGVFGRNKTHLRCTANHK